jgi:prepilin-type processing-associated H-X9-DG protein
MRFSNRRARAFTLVELLVVIGIIAALIGILLPVLSGVQARGRDIKCQSNVRQIVQAMLGYAAENKGSFPFGFYYDPSVNDAHPDPYNSANTWAAKGGTTRFVSWASQVGKYMVRGADGDNARNNFPPVLQCPEAAQTHNHVVGYVMNMVVGVAPRTEKQIGGEPPQGQLKPSSQSLMLKETALIWDTPVRPNWSNNVGHLSGVDIDNQRFWQGAHTPQFRYFSPKDTFGLFPPGQLGQNRPINLNVGSVVYFNRDAAESSVESYPYQGNLRFRHNKNTACNAGFADGSVRQFTASVGGDRRVRSHDALRRYFMTKWPPGVPPNPGVPF